MPTEDYSQVRVRSDWLGRTHWASDKEGTWIQYPALNPGLFGSKEYNTHYGLIIFDPIDIRPITSILSDCKTLTEWDTGIIAMMDSRRLLACHDRYVEVLSRPQPLIKPRRRGRKHKMRLPLVYPIEEGLAVDE